MPSHVSTSETPAIYISLVSRLLVLAVTSKDYNFPIVLSQGVIDDVNIKVLQSIMTYIRKEIGITFKAKSQAVEFVKKVFLTFRMH